MNLNQGSDNQQNSPYNFNTLHRAYGSIGSDVADYDVRALDMRVREPIVSRYPRSQGPLPFSLEKWCVDHFEDSISSRVFKCLAQFLL